MFNICIRLLEMAARKRLAAALSIFVFIFYVVKVRDVVNYLKLKCLLAFERIISSIILKYNAFIQARKKILSQVKSCRKEKMHVRNIIVAVACAIALVTRCVNTNTLKQNSTESTVWQYANPDGITETDLHMSKRTYKKFLHLTNFGQFTIIPWQKYWIFPFSLGKYLNQVERSGSHKEHMNYEWGRYETFKTFPMDSPVMPIRLSSNGFYYTGSNGMVECFSCHLRYCDWKDGDDPKAIHNRLSPDCEFVKDIDSTNVPIYSTPDSTSDNVGYEADGATGGDNSSTENSFRNQNRETPSHVTSAPLQQSDRAEENGDNGASRRINHKFPDYESFQRRMDSFNGWPCADLLRPEALVTAGFFYAGFSDCVRCFSCGGGLRNWEYGGGPWEEHARCFPWCKFLREQKGLDFVNEHQVTDRESTDELSTEITDIVSGEEALRVLQENKAKHRIKSQIKSKESTNINDKERIGRKNKDNNTDLNVIQEENNKLKEQLLCKICMDHDSNVVFLPCGHKVSCESCAPRIRKCAVCRVPIKGRVKAFMS